ncbi:MAG: hypothetical protein LBN39_13185, partial [Planctomycetaceae bacterium]|nr:hypothetical protein [Planctomycetaceae bacterium]
QSWGIGNEFAQSVLVHASRDFSVLNAPDKLNDAVVALSALLPSAGDIRWEDGDAFFAALQKFKTSDVFTGSKGAPKADTLFKEVETEYADMLLVTNTPSPSLSLIDFQKQYIESME